eukprot:jgi/Ulvmu1/3747/UM174_0003.1
MSDNEERQPSTSVSPTASCSDADDHDEDGMFRADCVRNLKQYLQDHKGMSAAAAKEFISKRVTISVSDTCYDDDGIRTVKVRSQIASARKSNSSGVASISLEYDYHHRCRCYSIEHFSKFSFSMPGASGNFFKSSMADPPRALDEYAHQIERRSFTLAQKKAKNIQATIFGNGWSALESVLMCYAAAGVCYSDSNAILCSAAESPVCKCNWLEHHTRKVCKALSEDDDGYETESFKKRYDEEIAQAEGLAREAYACQREEMGYGSENSDMYDSDGNCREDMHDDAIYGGGWFGGRGMMGRRCF